MDPVCVEINIHRLESWTQCLHEKIWAGKTRRSLRFSCFNSQHSTCAFEVWSVRPSLLLGTLLTTAIHETQSNHVKICHIMMSSLKTAKFLFHPRDAKRAKRWKFTSSCQLIKQITNSTRAPKVLWKQNSVDFCVLFFRCFLWILMDFQKNTKANINFCPLCLLNHGGFLHHFSTAHCVLDFCEAPASCQRHPKRIVNRYVWYPMNSYEFVWSSTNEFPFGSAQLPAGC